MDRKTSNPSKTKSGVGLNILVSTETIAALTKTESVCTREEICFVHGVCCVCAIDLAWRLRISHAKLTAFIQLFFMQIDQAFTEQCPTKHFILRDSRSEKKTT